MKLIIEDDEGRKTVVPFVRDEITIGRQEGNTIRLTERNVSRRHARLLRQNGHILVEDLGSYNGIRINGDRIQGQVQINEGDLIQIGDYDLAVQREAAEAAAPAAAGHTDKTQEVEAMVPRANGSSANAVTKPLPDNSATMPALPNVADPNATLSGDEPEEANPDDVTLQPQPAAEDPAARRQSTAIIRMDQVEQNRPRQIVDIDPAEAPRLIVINTELSGREFSCVRTELKIGRSDENDIAIDHRSLSRTHCKVVREDTGEWRVIDMQSANGLKVNDESYAQSALRPGDVLELGHVKLRFVSAGEKFELTDRGERSGKLSKVMAVSFVGLCLVAAAGFAYLKYGKPKPVTPPVVGTTKPVVPPKPEPEALTEEQQNALVDSQLKDARAKIAALDWAGAAEILNKLRVGESPHPEAQRLLVALKSEEPLKAALDDAEKAIERDDLLKAKELIGAAADSNFLKARVAEVQAKLDNASLRKMQHSAAIKPEPVKPPPPVIPPKPPPPAEKSPEQFLSSARDSIKEAKANPPGKSHLLDAKKSLDTCVKVHSHYPDCHKLLGTVWGLLGDGEAGAKEYEAFLKHAPPSHPQLDAVRDLLKKYYSGRQ